MRIKEGYTNTIKQELISIIIITYNAMAWADKCLKPLANVPDNAKVYIIDNGSSDGTQDFIKSNFKQFNFYQSKLNLGFGKANNLGFEMALKDGCSHFLLLNQDATISWSDIFRLAQIQDKNQDFGIISPLQLFSYKKVDFLHLKSLMKKSYTYFNDIVCDNQLSELYEIGYTNAAIWMVSKECLKKAGGFDPIFPHYGEDNDYSKRVNFFGFKIGLAPDIKAYHLRSQKIKTSKKTEKEYYVNFLVRLKTMEFRTSKTYIKILFELLTGSFNTSDMGSSKSWRAYFRLVKKYSLIKKHKHLNLSNSFCFLSISKENR